jgi:hypothetical protein
VISGAAPCLISGDSRVAARTGLIYSPQRFGIGRLFHQVGQNWIATCQPLFFNLSSTCRPPGNLVFGSKNGHKPLLRQGHARGHSHSQAGHRFTHPTIRAGGHIPPPELPRPFHPTSSHVIISAVGPDCVLESLITFWQALTAADEVATKTSRPFPAIQGVTARHPWLPGRRGSESAGAVPALQVIGARQALIEATCSLAPFNHAAHSVSSLCHREA